MTGPLIVQYLEYLGQVFTGNFGTTLTDNRLVDRGRRPVRARDLRAGDVRAGHRAGRRHPARHGRRRSARSRHGCRAPRERDPLLRDAGVLRRPRREAHLLGLAGLVPGERPGERPHRDRARSARVGTGIYIIDAIASGNPAYVQDVLLHAVLPAMVLGLRQRGSSCVWCAPTSSARTTCRTSTLRDHAA